MDWNKMTRKLFGIKTEEELQKKKQKIPKVKIKYFFETLVFAFVGAMILQTFLLGSSRVPTGSMESEILIGDFLLINKVVYGSSSPRTIPFTDIRLPYFSTPSWREPERNDIVVFEFPGNRDEFKPKVVDTYVKRCVGLPGDKIQIKDKVLFVNGKESPRPPHIQYIDPQLFPKEYSMNDIFPVGSKWNRDNYGPLYVPKKGDKINLDINNIYQWKTIIERELDKKNSVTVDGNQIYIEGRPVTDYILKDDYYFMLGDNRDVSLDCRFWGFVPRSKIVGKPLVIYWSWDPSIPWTQLFDLLSSVRLNRIAKLVN